MKAALFLITLLAVAYYHAGEGDTYESLLWQPGAHDSWTKVTENADHWTLVLILGNNRGKPPILYSSVAVKVYGDDGGIMPIKKADPRLHLFVDGNGTPSGEYIVKKKKHQIPSKMELHTPDTDCTVKLVKTGPAQLQ